jgi:hypothetical protein
MYATLHVETAASLPLKVHWHSDAPCACALYESSVALTGMLVGVDTALLQQHQQQHQWAMFDHDGASPARAALRPPQLRLPRLFGSDSADGGGGSSGGGGGGGDGSGGDDAQPSPLFAYESGGGGGVLPTPRNLAGDADAQVHLLRGWCVRGEEF